jgi:hypothetical protein
MTASPSMTGSHILLKNFFTVTYKYHNRFNC